MNQQFYGQAVPPMRPQRSNGFASASVIFGVMAIMSCMIIYITCFFGCLSILFALLSRQDSLRMPAISKVGFAMATLAILGTFTLTGISIAFLVKNFGLELLLTDPAKVLEDLVTMMNEIAETGGASYEPLL